MELWDPFQTEGIEFLLSHPRAFLWDDPGLGKTIQAVVAWSRLRPRPHRTLILCSLQKIRDWSDEFAKWSHVSTFTPKGTGKSRQDQVRGWLSAPPTVPVLILNRESLPSLLPVLRSIPWDVVIVDESHHSKNRRAKFTQSLKLLPSRIRWGLTATPCDGDIDVVLQARKQGLPKVQELWSQLHWLDPSGFSSYWRFVEQYCLTRSMPWAQFEIVSPNYTNLPNLRKQLKQYVLRRRDTDVPGQLPQVTYEDWWIDLSPRETKAYRSMEKTMLVWIDANTSLGAPTVLAQLSQLRRLTLGTEGLGSEWGSSKADVVTEFLHSTPGTHQWVVASNFMAGVLNLEHRLTDCVSLTGATGSDRDRVLQQFNTGRQRILLMTAQTGGEGLSLSQARGLISLDLPWSSTQYFQLCRRIVRGDSLHRHVRVVRVLARGTIDEVLVTMHREKRPFSPREVVKEIKHFLKN